MKKTNKLLFTLLLTVLLGALLCAGFAAAAEAPETVAEGNCGGEGDGTNLTWTLDSEGTLTISGEGSMEDYPISFPVSSTSPWYNDSRIKRVVVSSGVTTVSQAAFFNCTALRDVALPDTLTQVSAAAFFNCYALENFFFAGSAAQWESILTDTEPLLIVNFSSESFRNADVYYDVADWGYCGAEGDGTNLIWVYDADSTMTIAGAGAMADYRPVTNYGPGDTPWVNYYYSIKHLVVKPGVTRIGEEAFYDCHYLEDAVLPEGLTALGGYAFSGCTVLTHVDLPESLTSIGASAFSCAGLTEITIPDAVTEVGTDTFMGCRSLAEAHIGRGLTDLSSGMFDDCRSLTSIVIPDNITGSCDAAFTYCTNLKNVTLSKNMTEIGAYMFRACGMESIDLPASVRSIGYSAFYDCENLKTFAVPDGATAIEWNTFNGCTALEAVTIPRSVSSVGNDAFRGCDSLTDVYYGGSARQWNVLPIDNNDRLLQCTVHFADTSDDLVWSLEDGVLTVTGEGAVLPCLVNDESRLWDADTQTWVTRVYYSVNSVYPWHDAESVYPVLNEDGNLVLDDYIRVKKIVIGEGITEICGSAFSGFDPETVVLPSTLRKIPRQFTHPHRPGTLVNFSAFGTSALKDLYILNPEADMSEFAIKIQTRAPGTADLIDDYYAWYAEYLSALYEMGHAYMAAALTGYTGDSVVFLYHAALNGAAVYNYHYRADEVERKELDVRPEGVAAYTAGLLENAKDVWEQLGIPYDDAAAFDAAVTAYVNRYLGTDFTCIDDMYVLEEPLTQGGKPEAVNSEALSAAVAEAEARMLAIQAEYGVFPEGTAEEETEPQGAYYLGEPPEKEEDGEVIALTPPQDLYVHGYLGSTAEEAAAISGLKFIPVCPEDYTHSVVETAAAEPTVTTLGHTAGWYCEDCGVYLAGHEVIAPTAEAWGYCGAEGDDTNLVWTFADNTLTVTGDGAMMDIPFSSHTDEATGVTLVGLPIAPWAEYLSGPEATFTIVLKEGVTRIGKNAFMLRNCVKQLIVLHPDCDLSDLVIKAPVFLRGYLHSSAEIYANEHAENDCLFMPLCKADYRHEAAFVPGCASTCTQAGHEAGVLCLDCGEPLYGYREKPLAPHTWGGWTVVKPATDKEEGLRDHTCTVCGHTETESFTNPADNGNVTVDDGNGGRDDPIYRAFQALVTWFRKLLQFFGAL